MPPIKTAQHKDVLNLTETAKILQPQYKGALDLLQLDTSSKWVAHDWFAYCT